MHLVVMSEVTILEVFNTGLVITLKANLVFCTTSATRPPRWLPCVISAPARHCWPMSWWTAGLIVYGQMRKLNLAHLSTWGRLAFGASPGPPSILLEDVKECCHFFGLLTYFLKIYDSPCCVQGTICGTGVWTGVSLMHGSCLNPNSIISSGP